jgi:hypothetical protein
MREDDDALAFALSSLLQRVWWLVWLAGACACVRDGVCLSRAAHAPHLCLKDNSEKLRVDVAEVGVPRIARDLDGIVSLR